VEVVEAEELELLGDGGGAKREEGKNDVTKAERLLSLE